MGEPLMIDGKNTNGAYVNGRLTGRGCPNDKRRVPSAMRFDDETLTFTRRMYLTNSILQRASLAAPLRQAPASGDRCHTDARHKAPTPATSPYGGGFF